MKRQLDRLKGKRLVTGDPNLMTKDEICINATPNGVEVKEIGTDGSIKDIATGGEGVENHYYVFTDNSRYSDYFGQNKPALSQSSINLLYSMLSVFKTDGYVYTIPYDYTGTIGIRQLNTNNVPYNFIGIFKNTQIRFIDYEFSYIDRIPRYTDVVIKNFEELIEFMLSLGVTEEEGEAVEEIKNGIKRITEKEFNEFIDELSKRH